MIKGIPDLNPQEPTLLGLLYNDFLIQVKS